MADTHTLIASLPLGGAISLGALSISRNGLIAYIRQTSAPYTVKSVIMSTPWDITTGTFGANGLGLNGVASLFINSPGNYLYTAGPSFTISQYSLSGNLSTMSLVRSRIFSLTGTTYLMGCFFSDAGDIMVLGYLPDTGGVRICKYNLTVPWDINYASLEQTVELSTGGSPILWISRQGRRILYVSGSYIYKTEFSTSWDFTTKVLSEVNPISMYAPNGIFCNYNEDVVYTCGRITQYGDFGINSYTITPVNLTFWTNFKGQSEII